MYSLDPLVRGYGPKVVAVYPKFWVAVWLAGSWLSTLGCGCEAILGCGCVAILGCRCLSTLGCGYIRTYVHRARARPPAPRRPPAWAPSFGPVLWWRGSCPLLFLPLRAAIMALLCVCVHTTPVRSAWKNL